MTLGQGLAVLQEKSGRVYILNPLARWIWESSASGIGQEELKTILREETRHDGRTVAELFSTWAEAGLRPSLPENTETDRAQHRHIYWLGGGRIEVKSDDPELLQRFHACACHLEDHHPGPLAGTFALCREGNGYFLYKGEKKINFFTSANNLIVQAIWEVIEMGCRIPGRLMTIHGGAVAKEGVCCILAGPGGSGKTTLTAALVASGFMLVADDVIPVGSRNGWLESVPMSMCIKEGSWAVLRDLYPEADGCPVYSRFGKTVRFYPPPTSSSARPD